MRQGFEGAGHIRPLDFGDGVKTQEHVGDICLWPAPNRQITEASFWFENASPELASAVHSNLTLPHLENWIVWRAGPGHCPVDGQSISIKALLSTPYCFSVQANYVQVLISARVAVKGGMNNG